VPKTFHIGSASLYTDANTSSVNPAIAINRANQIVEVHSQPNASDNLHYILGRIDGPTYLFTSSPISFGKGDFPSVSIKTTDPENFVITVFTSGGNLYHRYGKVDFANNTINWNGAASILQDGSTNITNAKQASVAINPTGIVVVVYEDNNSNLRYKAGILNASTQTIHWNDSIKYSDGIRPKIALNTGISFVEVHQSEVFVSLYYNLGTVSSSNNNTTLTFLKSNEEYLGVTLGSTSRTPAVAINISGLVVEVHSPNEGLDLYYNKGQINGPTINFDPSKRYLDSDELDGDLTGNNPAVALTDAGLAIQVYQSNSSKLFCSVSTLADRSDWMKHYQTKTLRRLCIPGSHDAGMSIARDCELGATEGNTKTQLQDIGDQLDAGIRYFDIRPVFEDNKPDQIFTGHYDRFVGIRGCQGQPVKQVLNQVASFITRADSSGEVVILKFSHFLDKLGSENFFSEAAESAAFKQNLINTLIKLITATIPAANLYVHSNALRISDVPLATLTGGTGKAIILFDISELAGVQLNNHPDSGNVTYINSYGDLKPGVTADWVTYDMFSNTPLVNVMTSASEEPGQLFRIQQAGNHTGDFFLLSWTLTLSTGQVVNPFAYSVVEVAQFANAVVARDVINSVRGGVVITGIFFPNVLYVDLADGFATDVAIWVNEQRLR
jgi:hypothetical protein